MITGSSMDGRIEPGEMVLTPGSIESGMLKLIRSVSVGLLLALACWMAALSVHWLPDTVGFTSQTPLVRLASGVSAVRLTVKVLTARACGASKPTITSAPRRAMATIHTANVPSHISLKATFLNISVSPPQYEGGTRQPRLKLTNVTTLASVSYRAHHANE